MTLSTRILIGLGLGFVAGLIWGQRMADLEVVGQLFLALMQMTVLPYIMVSLISAIGALSVERAQLLAKFGVKTLLMLWLVVFVFIAIASFTFPSWTSASYFNPAMLSQVDSESPLVAMFPPNIFNALGSGAVPAVVLFSVLFGAALMQQPNKASFLSFIDSTQKAIGDISGMVMQLAPFGVFAIAAKAAGEMDFEELKGLYIYFVTLGLVCCALTFWVFPMLAKTLTNVHFSQIIKVNRSALITAFAAGNLMIVLPLIAENTRKLFQLDGDEKNEQARLIDVVVPLAYSVPVAGKLMAILFVLFAGWFAGDRLPLADYPALMVAGLLQLFGSSYGTVTSLLGQYRIPPELFGLFLVSENTLGNRLSMLASVMFIVTVTVLITSGALNGWHWKPKKLLRFAASSLVALVVVSAGLRFAFNGIGHDYNAYSEFINRDLLMEPAQQRVLKSLPASLPSESRGPVLERIRQRQKLRVGYVRDWLPYAFHNADGELVGLDVEVFHMLAKDMGVAVEFVRVYRKDISHLLSQGYLDIATGVAMTPASVSEYTLARSYIDETMAILLPKEHRQYARDWSDIKSYEGVTLGVLNTYFLSSALSPLRKALSVEEAASPRQYLDGEKENLSGIIMGAAGASAWTLIYPEFGVTVPDPILPKIPMAMPVSPNDTKFLIYMNQWLDLRKRDGSMDRLERYWLQGEPLHREAIARWNLWDHLFKSKGAE